MRHTRALRVFMLSLVLVIASGGCGLQAQDQSTRSPERPDTQRPADAAAKKTAPPKPLSADAAAPTGEPVREKEKRGNTPPGTDRAGDGPATGAIVDPQGATQK